MPAFMTLMAYTFLTFRIKDNVKFIEFITFF